ncbi:conserved hypothetical protein [Theileria orientalis strain Shintoku]|uniref:Uncharacterized protein n=1 Tax=Theileria orientalis strain Shintoku TaxID=869250 RepID=J4C4G8_THEOR|nr:conserved hypothetical protein [Theileria orientalis strain Shintoku]BAM42161.1 conserved hypothetical protein [Theileria orientalis strain Shintoku]|eukprot:XP_009692462.1 conserved hypothetical protein [Theileria orientalis strain Shintoku]
MGHNPTLQVNRISKCQKMEMAMESIRRTQKLGEKPWIKYSKVPSKVFDKEKVNVFMKLCLATKKSVTPRNSTTRQAPLENVNYNKQLEELDILVDIIKKTGNVGRSEDHRPLVHVPLPREFYELKPLVPFKSIAKKPKKRSPGSLHDVAQDLGSRYIFTDMSTGQVYGESKRLHTDLGPSAKAYTQDYLKLVTRKREETRVDKSTSISSRQKDRLDKSTSISSRPRERFDKSTSISSRVGTKVDKSTLTRAVSLNIPEKEESGDDGDTVAIKYDLRSEDTVVVLTPQRVLEKVEKVNLQSERGILREMSTISSNPFENHLSTYPSFDSVQLAEVQPNAVDAADLYLIDNSWAVLGPVTEQLKGTGHVKDKRPSRKEKERETVEPPTQGHQVEVLVEQTKTESKSGGHTEKNVASLNRYDDEVETKRYNTVEDESVEAIPHELLEIKPENKESASKVEYKEEHESKTAVNDVEKHETKSRDEAGSEEREFDEHEVDESKESKAKVTYVDEVPELNLESTKFYNEKHLEEEGRKEVDKQDGDLEPQDQLNKTESEVFDVMESDHRQIGDKVAESVQDSVDRQPLLQHEQFEDRQTSLQEHLTEQSVTKSDEQPGEKLAQEPVTKLDQQTSEKSDEQSVTKLDEQSVTKLDEQSVTKLDEQPGAQESEQQEGVQSDELPELPLAIADRPRRRRARSHKRSKKSLPGVQLSDYKGFYVVHATNDWSLS